MAGKPLILLPPSEGKAAGGDGPPLSYESLSFGSLNPTRLRMAKSLAQLSLRPRVAKRLLGVKGAALEKAMADNAVLEGAPTLPAIERYTGVMYEAINYQSLDGNAREAFGRTVVIMSGLFGMVRPLDMIPAYKLKMGATLLRRRSCASVWKPLISKSLASVAEDDVIWDLLPVEHSAAWDPAAVPYKARFKARFLDRGPDGQTKTVSHLSKALKGAFARHLVSGAEAAGSPETALELAAGFSHPDGYEFRPELVFEVTGATEIVFLKRQGD